MDEKTGTVLKALGSGDFMRMEPGELIMAASRHQDTNFPFRQTLLVACLKERMVMSMLASDANQVDIDSICYQLEQKYNAIINNTARIKLGDIVQRVIEGVVEGGHPQEPEEEEEQF